MESRLNVSKSFLSDLKIRSRLILLIVVLVIPLIILGTIGLIGINSSNASLTTVYEDRLVPTGQLAHMDMLLQENIRQVHLGTKHDPRLEESSLHSDHTIKKHTDAIRANTEAIHKFWKEYLATYLTEEERKLAREYEESEKILNEKGFQVAIDYLEEGNYKETNVLSARGLPVYYTHARDSLEKLLQLQLDVAKQEDQKAVSNFRIILTTNIIGIIASLALAIIMGIMIMGSVVRPVTNMVDRMKDLAEGEGDLTKRLPDTSRDEIGELARWLNRFMIKIHDIVKEIAKNTESVFKSSVELSEASQSLSAGTEQMSVQSSNIASAATQMSQNFIVISSSIEEMSISIGEVARKASDASGAANQADQQAKSANDMVIALDRTANEIGTVIESIVSIASQTNLLALNASIEAAGAGDAGKGFAVVAAEVKELAHQAAQSSENIKDRIRAIQSSSRNAIDSIAQIALAISQVNEINSAIAASVEEQSISSREIANNVGQTSEAAGTVSKNIEGISQAANDAAGNARIASQLASSLEELSSSLKRIVEQFKI